MNLSSKELLRKVGAGEFISAVAAQAGLTPEQFESWWKSESASRVPDMNGVRRVAIDARVEIERDRWGVPHIFAGTDKDLFFGFGYATAQDRLFQLDYLRRKACGRLSEILGQSALESDITVRTIGLPRIAAAQLTHLSAETRALVKAYSDGINALIEESSNRLPIEFDLLDYRPEQWSALDCMAIMKEFAWYLTGRFPVIVIPELAKRRLGEEALYQAFLQGEADEESILPSGSYPTRRVQSSRTGAAVGDPQEGLGSNNWVVSGKRSASGKPLLASDPHIAFAAVSCWYEVHLSGGSFNVTGTGYVGIPAVFLGRNERVAWGVTNNICSQRDLYQEKPDPQHPGCFLYDGRWEPAREVVEKIRVKGSEPICKSIRFSRNGPIVDEILPTAARHTGPVSLRWLGATPCDWLGAMQRMNRAKSAEEFRSALKGWLLPTWSVVFADVDGHIGYKSVGQIPIRNVWERGYRPGWDPRQQWDGLIPFEGMPTLFDPEQGWIATANNRPAPDDYLYPLSGTWSSGHRARRIRQMLEEKTPLSHDDFVRMHQDVLSLRAVECVPKLVKLLQESSGRRKQALEYLQEWDCRMETGSIGAAIFEVFFSCWSQAVVKQRFEDDLVELVSGTVGGLASELLGADHLGWFRKVDRETAVLEALDSALDELSGRLGPDPSHWSWGNAHRICLRHVLSDRRDLGKLLDRGDIPVSGNGLTVCNTGYDPNWGALMGANYRLIADLSSSPPGMWAVDAQGQSGHPGSVHFCDQLGQWISARYHWLSLDPSELPSKLESRLVLEPAGESHAEVATGAGN